MLVSFFSTFLVITKKFPSVKYVGQQLTNNEYFNNNNGVISVLMKLIVYGEKDTTYFCDNTDKITNHASNP